MSYNFICQLYLSKAEEKVNLIANLSTSYPYMKINSKGLVSNLLEMLLDIKLKLELGKLDSLSFTLWIKETIILLVSILHDIQQLNIYVSVSHLSIFISVILKYHTKLLLLFPLYFLASSLFKQEGNRKWAASQLQGGMHVLPSLAVPLNSILYENIVWNMVLHSAHEHIKLLTRNKGSSIVLFKGSHVYLLFNLLQ